MTMNRGFGVEAPFMRNANNGSNVLWLITACTALSLFGDSALYAVLPSQFDRFGLVVLQVGWLLSVNRLVRLPLNIPSGWLMRRFGPKWPLVIGLSLGSLSTLGFGLFRAFWALLACRCLWGVSWALIVVASYSFVFASTEPANRPAKQFTGVPRPETIADRDQVLATIDNSNASLVDAMPEVHYRGEFAMYDRPGHILGATNMPSSNLLDEVGHYRSYDELDMMHDDDRAGRVITYCGGGVAASSVAFTMHRLGYTDVAVYMGSLQEWAPDPENPMTLATP